MACGAPVLTTRRLSLPEVGGDAVAYCGVGAGDIAAALTELLDDPAAHARMARAHNPYGDGRAAPRIVEALLAAQPGRRALSA